MGGGGKSEIVFIDGRMNAQRYQEMLEAQLIGIGAQIGGQDWIFQQDNAPIHSAASTVNWFRRQNIPLMNWPSLSPDANPIENLWAILARKVYRDGRQFNNVVELKDAIREAWNSITVEDCRNLINSMPERIFEIILKKGASTRF